MGQSPIRLEQLSYDECMRYTPKHGTLGLMVWKMIQRIHAPTEPDILDDLAALTKPQLCRMVSIAKYSDPGPDQAERMYQALIDTNDLHVSSILMVQPWTQELLDQLSEEQRETMRQHIDPYSTERLIDTIYAIQHKPSTIERYSGARVSKSKRPCSPTRKR